MILEIFFILVFILFNGFFSASEIAVVTSRKSYIKNLSEKGMFITTCDFLPCDDTLELLVPLDEEISKFIAKIRRIVKLDDQNYHIGVELLHPPKNYIDYVNNLNAVWNS